MAEFSFDALPVQAVPPNGSTGEVVIALDLFWAGLRRPFLYFLNDHNGTVSDSRIFSCPEYVVLL